MSEDYEFIGWECENCGMLEESQITEDDSGDESLWMCNRCTGSAFLRFRKIVTDRDNKNGGEA